MLTNENKKKYFNDRFVRINYLVMAYNKLLMLKQ